MTRSSAMSAFFTVASLGTVWGASALLPALHASFQSAPAPLSALVGSFTLEGPFVHANLAVYVVRASTSDRRTYITLDEGLTARTVGVREKGAREGQDQNRTLSGGRDAYVAALLPHLKKHKDAIGLAVAINGTVTSADVYASPALFQQLSGKLLNSYALEAFARAERHAAGCGAQETQVTDFLSNPAAARAATETVGKAMQRSTRETDEAVMYEYGHLNPSPSSTRGIVVVHQSYLKK